MAAIDMRGLVVRFFSVSKPHVTYGTSKRASEFVAKAYATTDGPTPELRKLYRDYLANQRQRKSAKL